MFSYCVQLCAPYCYPKLLISRSCPVKCYVIYTINVAANNAVSHISFVMCFNKIICSACNELCPVTGVHWTIQINYVNYLAIKLAK